jgi:ABC-type cobalt transport system substrate-binding protein
MKQKDVALIILVIFFSVVISFFVSKLIFTSASQRSLTAEVVEPIDPNFQQPDNAFFNPKSINPTQLIKIGDSKNNQPF